MHYQVFIQEDTNQGYTAMPLGWPDCVVRGKTREEALFNVQKVMATRLAKGEIVTMESPWPPAQSTPNLYLTHFGRFKEDPTFDDFLVEMQAYRTEVEIEEGKSAEL